MTRTHSLYRGDDDRPAAALESMPVPGWIGVDTEFMRERTYFAELCLLQIATPDEIFCVDPLDEVDLERFWQALMARPWVLHSGRQDIEVLYQTSGRMPTRLFDTQIAAALLGHAPQIGYASLVREFFGKELPKSHTRADWSQRPLPDAMLHYAAEDVEYLLEAQASMSAELERLGRLQWVDEDSAALLSPDLYEVHPEDAIGRVKAARNLSGRARRAAADLAGWRERRALNSNRPRQWIMRDAALLAIAQRLPRDDAELAAIDGVPPATVRRSSRDLLRIVADSADGHDDYVPPARPGERQKAQLKQMQKVVARHADELGIAVEILAPRKELAAAMMGQRDGRAFNGWRGDVIGARLLELLD